jgi:hypothetical protein
MDPRMWDEPVQLDTSLARPQSIGSTLEASDFLLNRWPIAEGDCRNHAVQVCDAVLSGFDPPHKAKDAFVAAAREAGMTIL